jgi:hypothetical protein
MGSFLSMLSMTEEQKIAQMSPQARTDYLKCNSKRIASRKYYKENPGEWYAEYEF